MRSGCILAVRVALVTHGFRSICAQTCLHSGLDIVDGVWSALSWLSWSPFAQLTMLWKIMRAYSVSAIRVSTPPGSYRLLHVKQ